MAKASSSKSSAPEPADEPAPETVEESGDEELDLVPPPEGTLYQGSVTYGTGDEQQRTTLQAFASRPEAEQWVEDFINELAPGVSSSGNVTEIPPGVIPVTTEKQAELDAEQQAADAQAEADAEAPVDETTSESSEDF